MTLVSSIIADAYRETNMLPLGKEPNDNQAAEALRLYNALVRSVFGNDAGEALEDWALGSFGLADPACWPWTVEDRQYPPLNARIIATAAAAQTIYFSARPQDGARYGVVDPFGRLASVPLTLDGNGRTIEGAASIAAATDGLNAEWFYRADLGDWRRLTSLLVTDENPFPDEFDAMFVIFLAMRLSPRYGRTLDEQSIAILKAGKRDFTARYLQSRPLSTDDSISWPFMSVQSFGYGRDFSREGAFERGTVR